MEQWQIQFPQLILFLKYVLIIGLFQLFGLVFSYILFSDYNMIPSYNNFDVGYYLNISQFGYLPKSAQNYDPKVYAFYPSTSLFYTLFGVFGQRLQLIIFSIFMPAFLSFLTHNHLLKEEKGNLDWRMYVSSLYYLIIPFGFFFIVPYSEVVFAVSCLALLLLIFDDQQRYLSIIIISIIFALSRPNAVVLIPALCAYVCIEFLNKGGRLIQKKIIVSIITQAVSIVSLFTYHWYVVGDFFAARNAQSLWGRSKSTVLSLEFIVLKTITNINNSISTCESHLIICTTKAYIPLYGFIIWMSITISSFVFLKRTKFNILIQVCNLLLILLPLSSGTIGSFNRYLLLSPIILLIFPKLLFRHLNLSFLPIVIISVIFNIILLVLFLNGFWLG